jgi:hypothetical protein
MGVKKKKAPRSKQAMNPLTFTATIKFRASTIPDGKKKASKEAARKFRYVEGKD